MYRRLLIYDLNLLHFPLPAIVSILHRLTGILLVLFLPLLLFGFERSLQSETSFNSIKTTLAQPIWRFSIWIILIAFIFHWIAGLRHMIMDLHIGESRMGGKIGAFIVLLFAFILALTLGVILWNS